MSKPLPPQTTFAGVAPPWSLTNLDGNFTNVWSALNDYATYNLYLPDTGSVNALLVTPSLGLTMTLVAGLALDIKVANTNTSTTVTLNANGTGAVTVVDPLGVAPVVGGLNAGSTYRFVYDGTVWRVTPSPVFTSTGSWTTTISGAFSSNPTGTLKYRVNSGIAVVWAEANITAATNSSNTLSCSGLPAAVTPSANRILIAWGGFVRALNCPMSVTVTTSNTILLSPLLTANASNPTAVNANTSNPFDSSSTAGIYAGFSISYSL